MQVDQAIHAVLIVGALHQRQRLRTALARQPRQRRWSGSGLSLLALNSQAWGLAITLTLGRQQACRLPNPLKQLGIKQPGVILLQPLRHLVERIGHAHFSGRKVGHQPKQHIGGFRTLKGTEQTFRQGGSPHHFLLRECFLCQGPSQQHAMALPDRRAIKTCELIHRCHQPELGEALAREARLHERSKGGAAFKVFKNALETRRRPWGDHRRGPKPRLR